ncbi:MAG: hypothetical protein HS120_04345 [Burkholderiales bacterium]|nr:hypothetical protein [Burkholderiales bacterium]
MSCGKVDGREADARIHLEGDRLLLVRSPMAIPVEVIRAGKESIKAGDVGRPWPMAQNRSSAVNALP